MKFNDYASCKGITAASWLSDCRASRCLATSVPASIFERSSRKTIIASAKRATPGCGDFMGDAWPTKSLGASKTSGMMGEYGVVVQWVQLVRHCLKGEPRATPKSRTESPHLIHEPEGL